MTSSFNPFFGFGNEPNGKYGHIAGITGLLILLSITFCRAQENSPVQEKYMQKKHSMFTAAPKLELNPFRNQIKIKPFNSSQSFQRWHYSDLNLEIRVFPNPTSEFVFIDIPEDGFLTLSSSSGQILQSKDVPKGEIQLDLSEIKEGIYLVQLHTKKESYLQRLFVQH